MTDSPPTATYAFRISCSVRWGRPSFLLWEDQPDLPAFGEHRRRPWWEERDYYSPARVAKIRAEVTAKAHARRVEEAGHFWRPPALVLDPVRCKFGVRRLALVGTVTPSPPDSDWPRGSWHSYTAAFGIVVRVAGWTLFTVYRWEPDGSRSVLDYRLPDPVTVTLTAHPTPTHQERS